MEIEMPLCADAADGDRAANAAELQIAMMVFEVTSTILSLLFSPIYFKAAASHLNGELDVVKLWQVEAPNGLGGFRSFRHAAPEFSGVTLAIVGKLGIREHAGQGAVPMNAAVRSGKVVS